MLKVRTATVVTAVIVALLALTAPAAADLSREPLINGQFTRLSIGMVFKSDGTATNGSRPLPSYCTNPNEPRTLFKETQLTATLDGGRRLIYTAYYDSGFCSNPGVDYVLVELELNLTDSKLYQRDENGDPQFTWNWDKQLHCRNVEHEWNIYRGVIQLSPDITVKATWEVCWVAGDYIYSSQDPTWLVTQLKPEYRFDKKDARNPGTGFDNRVQTSLVAQQDIDFIDEPEGVGLEFAIEGQAIAGGSATVSFTPTTQYIQSQFYLKTDTLGCFVWGVASTGIASGVYELPADKKICIPYT